MKHLFKEGKFIDANGRKEPYFHSGADFDADTSFFQSLNEITSVLRLYDFKHIDQTDYYYIYKINSQSYPYEIEDSILKILQGNINDVVNFEDITLGSNECDSEIFFDVNNNFILVKGKENLKQMCIELLMYSHPQLKRTKETEESLLQLSKDIPIIKKMNELDVDKKASMDYYKRIFSGEFDDKFREITEGEVGRDIKEPFELTDENVQEKIESYSSTLDVLRELMPNEFSRKLTK